MIASRFGRTPAGPIQQRLRSMAAILVALGASADPASATDRLVAMSQTPPGVVAESGGGEMYGGEKGISADGRYSVFGSLGQDLVAGFAPSATGSFHNLYLHDRITRTNQLISHSSDSPLRGVNGSSYSTGISSDGNYVLFVSNATDLVPGFSSSNGSALFQWERASGLVRLVSHIPASATTNSDCCLQGYHDMSADGSAVFFESSATDLVAGYSGGGGVQIFQWLRSTGEVSLVSHAVGMANVGANGYTRVPVASSDGEYVAYWSSATNLVAGYPVGGGYTQVFLWERATDSSRLVSHTPGSTLTPSGGSSGHVLSADGSKVFFQSAAGDLVSGY